MLFEAIMQENEDNGNNNAKLDEKSRREKSVTMRMDLSLGRTQLMNSKLHYVSIHLTISINSVESNIILLGMLCI